MSPFLKYFTENTELLYYKDFTAIIFYSTANRRLNILLLEVHCFFVDVFFWGGFGGLSDLG